MNDPSDFISQITLQIQETEEEFIYQQIMPFCESITQKKIDKAELKRLLLLGIQRDKKGKWKNDGMGLYCSECGFSDNQYFGTPFCPNCGADMGGEEK